MVALEGRGCGADQQQQAKQQALVLAQRGHHQGDAALHVAESDHRRRHLLLHGLVALQFRPAVITGGFQRAADGAFVHGRAAEDTGQRIAGGFGLALLDDFANPLVNVRVRVAGRLRHDAGATQHEIFLPGGFTDLEQLRVDDLSGGQEHDDQKKQQRRQGGKPFSGRASGHAQGPFRHGSIPFLFFWS